MSDITVIILTKNEEKNIKASIISSKQIAERIIVVDSGSNDKTIEITKNELKILSYLIKNKGKIVSRENLMNYLWDCEMFIDDNTLSVNVTRIRKKLDEIGIKNVIETRRGLGYIIP